MYGAAGPPRTDGQAIAALVLGIVGLFCLIPAILAIVFGFLSKARIEQSNGQLTGRGMSIAGIVLGIVSIVIGVGFIAVRVS